MTRADIVAEARKWIGTPYRHQASEKGVGTDCLGLVRGIWRGLFGDEPEAVPPYTPGWAEALREETLLLAAQRHLIERPLQSAQPGDVILFRMASGTQLNTVLFYRRKTLFSMPIGGDQYVKRVWCRGGCVAARARLPSPVLAFTDCARGRERG